MTLEEKKLLLNCLQNVGRLQHYLFTVSLMTWLNWLSILDQIRKRWALRALHTECTLCIAVCTVHCTVQLPTTNCRLQTCPVKVNWYCPKLTGGYLQLNYFQIWHRLSDHKKIVHEIFNQTGNFSSSSSILYLYQVIFLIFKAWECLIKDDQSLLREKLVCHTFFVIQYFSLKNKNPR